MITQILPDTTIGVEVFGDAVDCAIFPSEANLVAGAVPKRQREFVTGRVCAHRALAALGFPPSPILAGARGEPLWPAGVAGSITHCEGYRACAVVREAEIASLGIDAEPHLPLPEGVLRLISSPGERGRLRKAFAEDPATHWDRLLFCIKEAIYKAWYPRAQASLDFSDAAIDFDPRERRFTATLKRSGLGIRPELAPTLSGRWRVEQELVIVTTHSSGCSKPPGST